MPTDRTRERLTEELTGHLLPLGLDVESVELTPAGRRRVLRVAVDKDGGVTMDEVAEATREISRLLDSSEVMGEQPYTLEVTSPGVDRPLTLPRHWRRNQGRLVRVTTTDGATILGRVVRCRVPEPSAGSSAGSSAGAAGEVELEVDGTVRVLDLSEVAKALVQVELNPPKPADTADVGGDRRAAGEAGGKG